MTEVKILALVGSLRRASVNRQIAELAAEVAPQGVTVTVFDGLGELPFYNEDIDDAMNTELDQAPAQAVALRAAAADAHAALVVTPEYNGTIPAVIKNAIDWLSRPFGNGALKDKPLAVIGGSMGRYGGVWAHDETRKSFGIAGARVNDAIKLSVPLQALGGGAPADHEDLSANVRDVVGKLAAEVG
ncbi:NAD(P)H-dependent oxidoreductase [Mycobacterium sp. ML4]